MSNSKIEKTIARQKEKIEEGQYYEAHQQLRVIAARYIKQDNHEAAISVLFGGAQLLLQAGQGGSGGDLCMLLMEVYNKAELLPNAAAKGKVLSLLRSFPPEEPTKKRFVGEVIGWSAKFGDYPAGDPELHHVAGQLYADDYEPYDAERHLAVGTKDSPQPLARLEHTWYLQDDDPSTAGLYAARAVFPLLLTRNLRGANACLLLFTSRLAQETPDGHSAPSVQEVSGKTSDVRIYPGLPLLNFLSLLLLAVERGSADLFKQLKSHYSVQLRELDGIWDEALEQVGEIYFGVKKPRQFNPLMDMMGSMFGGGGGGAPAKKEAPKSKASGQASLAAPGLD